MNNINFVGIALFFYSTYVNAQSVEPIFKDTIYDEHHFAHHGHQPKKPVFVSAKKTPLQTFEHFIKHHKGKVIYVDFWASWCLPCMKEMTELPALYAATLGKDVVFLYINLDQNKEYWQKAVKWGDLRGYHFNAWVEGQPNDLTDYLEIISLPQYILINKKGEIVTNDAPRPSKLGALTKSIDKLLLEDTAEANKKGK